MGVVAVSPLRPPSDVKVTVKRLSEDIWLTNAEQTASYIDIFILVEKDSPDALSSVSLVMDGKVEKAQNVSSMWYKSPQKLYKGVGGYMYSLGLKKIRETDNHILMFIDGIECLVPKQRQVEVRSDKGLCLVEIRFRKPMKPGETVGLKIEVLLARGFSKSKTYSKSFYFDIFPYCHWAIGADVLRRHGFVPENLTPIEAYYIYLFLPPKYEIDRRRTTEFLTIDLSKCETCSRFCPFLERVSDLTDTSLKEFKKDREGVRWQMRSLSKWQSKSITVVFSQSKSIKVMMLEHLLELLAIGFLVNVMAGLVFYYDPAILVVSSALLLCSIGVLTYIFKKYHV